MIIFLNFDDIKRRKKIIQKKKKSCHKYQQIFLKLNIFSQYIERKDIYIQKSFITIKITLVIKKKIIFEKLSNDKNFLIFSYFNIIFFIQYFKNLSFKSFKFDSHMVHHNIWSSKYFYYFRVFSKSCFDELM